MKNRLATYRNEENSQHDAKIMLTMSGESKEVSCISKEKFEKEHPGKIVGYIHKDSKAYTGKEYATLEGLFGIDTDIYSGKKSGENVAGYIETTDGEYLAVTEGGHGSFIIIAIIVAIVVIAGIVFAMSHKSTKDSNDSGVLNPVSEVVPTQEQEEEEETVDNKLSARVALPAGTVDFSGELNDPDDEIAKQDDPSHEGNLYEGNATITVTMTADDAEHILIDSQEVSVEKGILQSVNLDFTKLDAELTPGVYKGNADITYPDGTEIGKEMDIFVVSTVSGTLGISYSDQATVNLGDSTIAMSYAPDNSPYDSYVQIIIVSDGEEYLLGESGLIKNNQTVNQIPLNEDMKSKLQSGVYDGIMRVYVAAEDSEDKVADIHTDIEISISVQ